MSDSTTSGVEDDQNLWRSVCNDASWEADVPFADHLSVAAPASRR
ncbi:hypothetical protein OG432_34085 [Streptomyces sp. NBC_00442]